MTPEQLRQNAAAMLAHADGKPVQYRNLGAHCDSWCDCLRMPLWNFGESMYRPKPTPVTRPWSKPEDVPGPVCWLRSKIPSGWQFQILMLNTSWVSGVSTEYEKVTGLTYSELDKYEYSTDRKTWYPCTVTEDAK